MADKPRVKAPKQRTASTDDSARRRRMLTIAVVVGGLVLGFAAVAAALGMVGGGGGKTDVAGLRTAFKDAGCTLQVAPALKGAHSITDPSKTSPKWNTDPPTSGPHYGFNPNGTVGTVIWGAYDQEVELARIVHNLEHGGVYILYGKDVPDATVEQLRAFYDDHKTGTVMAPLERLGRQRLDCSLEPPVARVALDCELRLLRGERALELDDLLHAPSTLDERGPYSDEDRSGADCETDEQGCNDHRADPR